MEFIQIYSHTTKHEEVGVAWEIKSEDKNPMVQIYIPI